MNKGKTFLIRTDMIVHGDLSEREMKKLFKDVFKTNKKMKVDRKTRKKIKNVNTGMMKLGW
jgi:hypothetical protein